ARELLVIYYAEVADAERGIKQGLALLSLVANQPEFNIAQSYRAMAMLSQVDKNYQQASAYWGKAIEAYTIKQDTIDMITTHIESGLFHDAIGEYETALEVLTTSLELSRAFGNYVAEHYILGSIGKVYTHLGDFDKAFDYLNQSLRLKQVYYRPVSVAYGFYDLQQAYLKAGKYKKSIEYGKSLQQTLNINPGTYLFKHSLEATRIASKALGREIPPLVDASKYPITDALNSHELLMQLRQMRALHSNEKTSEFIYEQQGSIGELKATTEFQKKAIYYGISVLMLLFGGAYMIRSRAFAIKERNIQEEFSHQLLRYQEKERQRISRDLHDSIGQSLVLIKNKVQLNNDVDTSSLIANTLAEVRSISKQLHPVLLEKIGLTASLEKLMDEVDSNTEIFMETEIESIDNVFPKENELHIYRIVQEGINNMLKHANAVSAHFKIEHLNNEVRCSLADRGSGFDLTTDSSKFQGLGMQTLKERTKILHGKLVLDSTKGKGTTLTLIVPKPTKP
ncbi:MAG: sensor histidine kinase, partial [Marinoscillum sp.]